MRKYGLIGYPLAHSFSKQYFTKKFQDEHLSDCSYENFPIREIAGLMGLIQEEPALCGLNVTIPYKSDVLGFLDTISSEAREIGAVNVIKIRRNGKSISLSGFNSDITGIRDSLIPYFESKTANAIILGSGGSSKAVFYVLKQLGMNVTVVSRSKKTSMITYAGIDQRLMKTIDLIVNTTPLGMFPNTDTFPDINYSLLEKKHILFDLVYNPEFTVFLRRGLERGCTVISGLKMLHSQAEKAWEIWNNDDL